VWSGSRITRWLAARLISMRARDVLLVLLTIGLLTGLGSAALSISRGPEDVSAWAEAGLLHFSTGTFEAVVIYLLFEMVLGTREKRQAEQRADDQRRADIARARSEQQVIATIELRTSSTAEGRQAILDRMARLDLFRGANLESVNLEDAQLRDVDLRGVCLRGANLVRADLQRANLLSVDLRGAVLIAADLRKANLESSRLDEADLTEVRLNDARLTQANLHLAVLRKAWLIKAALRDATLQGAILTEANLEGACLQGVDLRWADLRGGRLFEADLREVSLDETRFDEHTVLPDGTQWTTGTEWSKFGAHIPAVC